MRTPPYREPPNQHCSSRTSLYSNLAASPDMYKLVHYVARAAAFDWNAFLLFYVHSFINARNEVGARLCFYRHVWFCSQGGCLPQCMLGYHTPRSRHPPWKQTPPGGRHPPEQTPPRSRTPWRQTPPGADTPGSRHPPGSRHTPPGADTTPLPEADTHPLEQTPTQSRHPPEQTHTPPSGRACWEIRWTRGRYASYWNAILFKVCLCVHRLRFDLGHAPWRVNNWDPNCPVSAHLQSDWFNLNLTFSVQY